MLYWGIFLCGFVTFYWIISLLWHGIDTFSLLHSTTDFSAVIMNYIPVTLLQKVSESLVGIGIATIDYLSFEVSDLDHFLLV
jgi:hypothetical protein